MIDSIKKANGSSSFIVHNTKRGNTQFHILNENTVTAYSGYVFPGYLSLLKRLGFKKFVYDIHQSTFKNGNVISIQFRNKTILNDNNILEKVNYDSTNGSKMCFVILDLVKIKQKDLVQHEEIKI